MNFRPPTFLALILFVFLAGCASGPQKHTPKLELLEQHKTALILAKGSYFQKNLIASNDNPITYEFARLDDHYMDKKSRFFYQSKVDLVKQLKNTISSDQGYDVFMVEPGTYVLENMRAHIGNAIITTKFNGINFNNQVTYGAFTVKAGELLYVGDFQFKFDGDQKKYVLLVTDHSDSAVNYLKEHYPEYENLPLKTRLLTKTISQ